ncbi:sideroflexin-1-like [Oscarella lobularis]|uniref:sideroflexin-1-like n=1 Tax=Oscarella lobularis TaxID=121494 RepID=UPI0033139981
MEDAYTQRWHTPRINLDKPRYDQSTFSGRAKHFFQTTDPRNLLASEKQLDAAKELLALYRKGEENEKTTHDEVWRAKTLYDSAFHPETGEKMFILGRMSAQVPCNMTITGSMLTFYRHPAAILFWQWINQSFNAIVNYTNSSGDLGKETKQLSKAYTAATGAAMATALGVSYVAKRAPAVISRMGPFAAVAAANCINIPLMRQKELDEGIIITDADGNELGKSKKAARKAISQVVISRIGMAAPAMMTTPLLMGFCQNLPLFKRFGARIEVPFQIGIVGLCLTFATPLCCAIFPQRSSLAVNKLESELQEKIKSQPNPPDRVYFNKGL